MAYLLNLASGRTITLNMPYDRAVKIAKFRGLTADALSEIGVPTVPTVPTVPGVTTTSPSTSQAQPPSGVKPSLIKPQITIGATADETAKAAGKGCPTPIGVYKIKTRDGREIFVESISKEAARQKAEAAGYDVVWVTSVPGGKVPAGGISTATPPVADIPSAGGIVIGEYDVQFERGKPVRVEAVNEAEAIAIAQNKYPHGLGAALSATKVEAQADKYLVINGQINQNGANQIRSGIEGNTYLLNALDKAIEVKNVGIYNNAVDEYNGVISDANWFSLYKSYKAISGNEAFKDNWEWFQETFADKLKDAKYMSYLESPEFRDKYASVIQPSSISNEDYNLIKPYITPEGFDSKAAYRAGENNPTLAVNIIRVTNAFTLATLGDETRAKLNSGEWTLLPYGQVIETKTLEQMPPTYRHLVQNSGLVGYEAYQGKVLEWNKTEGWVKNTIDAIVAQSVGLGQDIKNFAILESQLIFRDVKEGDPKFMSYYSVEAGPPIPVSAKDFYTAEEAEQFNVGSRDMRELIQAAYQEADMAAQEWLASRSYLQPVYAEGFVGSIQKDPSSIKDPLLWTETFANTLPYTVATGLIAGGFFAGGPAGIAVTAPLAFGITLSVEGNDIYKDAIAHGASHDQALKLANIYGAISASIETLGDTILVGAFGVGGGAFAQSLGKNVGKNIITGAAKKYGWKNLTAGMIKDFVNQGGQEFFQEVVHNAAIKTVDQNQDLLENTANAFVSGVIGTVPFVLVPAGGQAIRGITIAKVGDVRVTKGKAGTLTPIDVTPQMQVKILNKVFAPVAGFTVETKTLVAEQLKGTPTQIAFQKQQYKEGKGRKIYEAGKGITVGLVDKKTVITGKANVDEVALAYKEMSARVNEYALTQLKLKQAQEAIANFGLAKSKSQLRILNEYKARASELEAKLKELKGPMVEAVKKFSNVFLKNSVGLEAEQKAEVREMAKTIAIDIDSVTSQLFGERTAIEIAKDVKELEGQIKVIEDEMAKGMTREQLEGYARLIAMLKGQVGDLVNELRMRYLAEGEKIKPETKKLAMEVMSLQARLIKAVENLNNFAGSALDYDVYRKGELATEAEVVKLERDTFEAIQKTTEAVWGKEHYADKLAELNTALRNLIATMREANAPHERAIGISFNIYDAIRERQKEKALRKQLEALKSEIGKIKDPSLRQQAEIQTHTVENIVEDLSRESRTELRPGKPKEIRVGTEGLFMGKAEDYGLGYTDADFEAEQKDLIKQQAEGIVERRFNELMKHTPMYIKKWGGEKLLNYLRELYDAEYFKEVHEGVFKDLDDYLSIENEMERIWMQIVHQQWLQKMDEQIASFEAEADLAKDLQGDETGRKRRDSLDRAGDKAKKTADELRQQLKEKQKTKVAVQESQDTLTAAERKKLEEARDKLIQEKLQKIKDRLTPEEQQRLEELKRQLKEEETPKKPKGAAIPMMITKKMEATLRAWGFTQEEINKMSPQEAWDAINKKAKSEAKAKKLIKTAKKEIAKEETKAKEEEEESEKEKKEAKARPGALSKIAQQVLTRYKEETKPKEQVFTKTALEAATKVATKVATKAATKTKAQTATQVQTQTQAAVQAAVKTALETETKTATEEEIKTATELITNIVTKTKTKIRPKTSLLRVTFKPTPFKKGKIHREGPALAVWKQGRYWVSIFSPFRTTGAKEDVVYSRTKPPWGSVIARGRHAPKKTLRSMGKIPELITVPMGVVTARIRGGRHLSFSRSNGRRRGRVIQG